MQQLRFMITGLPKCGKSTIKRVVFQGQEPCGSMILESGGIGSDGGTAVVALNSFVQLHISTNGGCLGEVESLNANTAVFAGACSIIFVIDLMSDYLAAIAELYRVVAHVEMLGLRPRFDVFLHKCDGLEPKVRLDVLQEISQQVSDELGDRVQLQFFLTSLYDCSILHAMSRVVQRHLSASSELVNILDRACTEYGYSRAFLLDVVSQIFLATNSSAYDPSAYELSSDALGLVEDMAAMYHPHSAATTHPFAVLELVGADAEPCTVIYCGIGRGLSLVLLRNRPDAITDEAQLLAAVGQEIVSILYK